MPEEEQFGFGEALGLLNQNRKVARAGWNGENMHVCRQNPDENSKMTRPYLYICTPQGDLIPWVISQTDVLGLDWLLVG